MTIWPLCELGKVKITLTDHAAEQLDRAISYWDAHRASARVRVEDALAKAGLELEEHPRLGQRYENQPRYRTWPLSGTPYRLFYLVDEEAQQITVMDIWSPHRGDSPQLE